MNATEHRGLPKAGFYASIYIYIYIICVHMQVLQHLIYTKICIAIRKITTCQLEEIHSEVSLHHKDLSWLENNSRGSLECFNNSEVFVLKKAS